jgi:lysophospholipase L1-like esterase
VSPGQTLGVRLLMGGVAVAALALAGGMAWRLQAAADLARRSEPWQQQPAAPQRRLLIVGDSTAVVTGASAAVHSLAGLIGQAYPDLLIQNRAEDGATLADVIAQLAGDAARYDMVLVQAGGNDVIRARSWFAVQADLDQVLQAARQRAGQVVLMPAGNVGNAPFFWPPLSWWMGQRSRTLHRLVRAAAAQHGATIVDLFHDAADDPFVQHPALNARDGLHPSDAGYRVWFTELQRQANLPRWLGAAG